MRIAILLIIFLSCSHTHTEECKQMRVILGGSGDNLVSTSIFVDSIQMISKSEIDVWKNGTKQKIFMEDIRIKNSCMSWSVR